MLEISSFYTCVPKITIIWCTVPEIRSETDKKFCHFGPFFALLPPPLMIPNIKILKKMKKMPGDIILLYIHVHNKWRSCDIWFLKYKVQQTEIFDIWGHFFPFSTLITWKIKILTLKKTPQDIIILHICTTNDNHMMYGSWDMEHNRTNPARVYFRLKLSSISRCCPQWLIFFKLLFYENNYKEAMKIGGGQIKGALFNCFVVKKCPFVSPGPCPQFLK